MPAGRPRSETARRAVLDATRDELSSGGYDRLTIDRVAVTAGVSKQTVYRWYRSKSALVADCLLQGYILAPRVAVMTVGTARDDILRWMRDFVEITRDPQALALIRAASAAAAEDRAIADGFQHQMNTLARDAIVARLDAGISAGEIRDGTPSTVVAQAVVGSLIYQLLTHETITDDFVDDLASVVFAGITQDSQ